MKVTINTTAKNIEMANFILAQGYDSAIKSKEFQKAFDVSPKQLEGAEKFRMALLYAFNNGRIKKQNGR